MKIPDSPHLRDQAQIELNRTKDITDTKAFLKTYLSCRFSGKIMQNMKTPNKTAAESRETCLACGGGFNPTVGALLWHWIEHFVKKRETAASPSTDIVCACGKVCESFDEFENHMVEIYDSGGQRAMLEHCAVNILDHNL